MKLVPYLFGIFFINVTFAAELDVLWLGDNPYASIYNKTNSLLIINTYDKISELEEKYNLAVGREQSYANRMLGAVSIGAGGIGGMMLASGIAEQSADAAAERDMSAYLATFRCDYGVGKNIRGGETNITLPGANILLNLRTEYITLAADIKERKTMLGLSPGIESAVIDDATEYNLYNNTSLGKTDGAYTSISRALSEPGGDDAIEWAAQKSESQQQTQTGGIVGGAGVGIGIIGNVIINGKK